MAKNSDPNARKALDEMKLEIAKDLSIELTNAGMVGGLMTKRLVEMGKKQLTEKDNQDTFNPS